MGYIVVFVLVETARERCSGGGGSDDGEMEVRL